ncbi:MAG: peptidyl-prolyl cis-trans isomerase [Deltaproteobacteria bacterium]|nr:peptidyl-prolyl cis-trans isomerase [Deltaproteobacteria bacterium]
MRFGVLALATPLTLCACSSSSSPATAPSPAVATINDRAITVADFKSRLAEQAPAIRVRYKTLDRRKEFLDNLVRFEVMLQEAQRRGLENDPEVRATLEKLLVQRLLRARQEEVEKGSAPSEAEVRKYYEEHLAEFVRPARVRVSHVFFASPKGDPKHAAARDEAAQLLADIKAKEAGSSTAAFAEAAALRSDDQSTKSLSGDLGYKTLEELTQTWTSPVATAAMALKSIGELSGPVETSKGFHLLKLTGRQEGMEQTLESVKPRIESRLTLEKRARALDDFAGELKAKATVKIDERLLEGIDVDNVGTAPSP